MKKNKFSCNVIKSFLQFDGKCFIFLSFKLTPLENYVENCVSAFQDQASLHLTKNFFFRKFQTPNSKNIIVAKKEKKRNLRVGEKPLNILSFIKPKIFAPTGLFKKGLYDGIGRRVRLKI